MNMKLKIPTGCHRGFTFVELIIVVVVFLVGTLSVVGELSATIRLNHNYRSEELAWEAAQQTMEQLTTLATSAYDNVLANSTPSFTVPGFSNPADAQGVIQVVPDPTDPDNLASVYVTVSFRNGQGQIVGGDTNLDGIAGVGDVLDMNGILVSPVKLVTKLARR